MLRGLVAMFLAGVVVVFSIGCGKPEPPKGRELPKIPQGLESKPGFGAMNEKPATEPPTTDDAAPAGGGADTTGGTEKTN